MSRSQDIDVYAALPFRSKIDAQKTTLSMSSAAPFAPSYVIASVTAHSDPTSIYTNRVKGRMMLLENPARDSRLKKDAERQNAARKADKEKRKLGILGRRKREEKGAWKFDSKQIKYERLLPLHHLWLGYMSELLNLPRVPKVPTALDSLKSIPGAPSSSAMHPKLLKADFHGCILTVKQSKHALLVGMSGILIHETENAFKIVTKGSKVKLIPKQNSVFTFAVPLYNTLPESFVPGMPYPLPSPPGNPQSDQAPSSSLLSPSASQTVLDAPHLLFELYGNQFRFRSAERAGRKFKHKETIEL